MRILWATICKRCGAAGEYPPENVGDLGGVPFALCDSCCEMSIQLGFGNPSTWAMRVDAEQRQYGLGAEITDALKAQPPTAPTELPTCLPGCTPASPCDVEGCKARAHLDAERPIAEQRDSWAGGRAICGTCGRWAPFPNVVGLAAGSKHPGQWLCDRCRGLSEMGREPYEPRYARELVCNEPIPGVRWR